MREIIAEDQLRYQSTKTYTHAVGLSCVFRQHRAKSHCKFLHGYALQVEITFTGRRDKNGWVQDFGALAPIKEYLTSMFDHKLIAARSDPDSHLLYKLHEAGVADLVFVDEVGCENFARMILLYVQGWLSNNDTDETTMPVDCTSVTVREHDGNSATVSWDRFVVG